LKGFFSRPLEISFKDVLAIAFSGTFLYFCWKAIDSKDALAVVQVLVPLLGIILGGYFVQESAALWFQRSQGIQQQYGTGYTPGQKYSGGDQSVQPTTTTSAPPDIPAGDLKGGI